MSIMAVWRVVGTHRRGCRAAAAARGARGAGAGAARTARSRSRRPRSSRPLISNSALSTVSPPPT